MPSLAPLIEFEAVDLMIDGKDVLQGLTFQTEVRRLAVLGRNGSGKTTLARVMSGLQKPSAGRVRVGGIDVAKDRRAALRTVGILFQNPDHQIIFPTVSEELSFGLKQMGMNGVDVAQRVDAILAEFGKSSWRDAAIHTMSQGQRQLVCLMAILAMAPKVIILDEPFAGLDIPTALHLSRVLERIEASLVHITHDPAVVAGYDHALWMEQGRLKSHGPASKLAAAFEMAMNELGARDDLTHLSG